MSVIIGKIVSIFLITAVGYVANRRGILPDASNKYLVDLMMLITCPCMIISSITTTELTDGTALLTIQMLGYAVIWFALSTLLARILCLRILRIKAEEGAGVYIACIATLNNGFMGLPISFALFGDDVLFLMILFQTILVAYVYSVGVIDVNYGAKTHTSFRSILKSLANPCTLSAVFSFILLFAGIRLPEVLFSTIDSVGSITVPLSMMVVGIQLGSSNLGKVLGSRSLVISSVVKMVFWPLLTFLAVNWLPLPVNVKITLTFGAAFPAAVAVVPIASMEGRDSVLAAELVAFTTLLSIATLPVCALLLMGYYGVM